MVAHADLSSALLPWALEVLGVAALRAAADSARLAGQGEALLAELLTGAGGADLGARLEGLGFEGSEFAVAVAELHGVQPRTPRGRARLTEALLTLRTAGDAFFARRGHRALSALRGGRVVWLWSSGRPETQRAALLAALLAASEADVRLGLSDPHARWQDAPQAQRQAVLALQATRFPRSSQSFSLLDPVHWVLSAQPAENLEALARTVLEPLRQADASGKLLQTLRLYLQDTHDLPALAERLHIHLNTLRYRLARIEQILGQPLSHPATLVRLYLAVQAEQGRGAS
nr:helix-turn-helix domain-containing protein [Deinobacterium chartae]